MNQFVRFILILGVLSAICAGALAYTDALTSDQIAAQVVKATQAALAAVVPDAATFEPQPEQLAAVQAADPSLISVTQLYRALSSAGPVGYACNVTVTGYGGPVQMMVGVSDAGTITGLKIIVADNETPGLGARIKDPAFQAQFSGKDATQPLTLVKTTPSGDSQVQAISAATISSSAVLRAVNAATGVYRAIAGAGDQLTKLKEDAVRSFFPAADSLAADPDLLAQLKAADPDLASAGDIYYAKQGDAIIGVAVSATGQGYAGQITVVVGFDNQAKIVGVAFVSLPDETVGLGSKITETSFTSQFVGREARQLKITTATPGADEIQAVTGATRSSNGAVSAVNVATALYVAMPAR